MKKKISDLTDNRCDGMNQQFLVTIISEIAVDHDDIKLELQPRYPTDRIEIIESPFCINCKESDCIVSTDGTCAMIRKYLKCLNTANK